MIPNVGEIWEVQERDGHFEIGIGHRPNHWKELNDDDDDDDIDDDTWGIILCKEAGRTCQEFIVKYKFAIMGW
jgi:hypothetical protein